MFNIIKEKIKELFNFLNSSEDELIYLDNKVINLDIDEYFYFMNLSLEEKYFFLDRL